MKIICESSEETTSDEKPQELLEKAIEEIIAICNVDQNFSNSKKFINIDQEMDVIDKKMKHQTELYEKSLVLKKNIAGKVKDLDDEIFDMKVSVLEKLGSEL